MINLFKRKKRISKRMNTPEKVMVFLLSPESKEFRIYFLKKLSKYFERYNDMFITGIFQNMFYKYGFFMEYEQMKEVFKLDFEEAKRDFQANGWEKTDWWINNNYQKLMYIDYLITKQ